MSGPLAIAAVSAVLKNMLDNALVDNSLSSGINAPVTVRLIAPNRIKTDNGEATQINLYLYQITPNIGWRNACLPSRNFDGDRVTNPPLALDLHYLLTVYGKNDFEAEILLGYAMQVLHETPFLSRDAIRATLSPPSSVSDTSLPPALGTLDAADLADQVEQVKIVPQFLSTEEMSKLWTAMQTGYHTSVGYQVSVVLIQSRNSTIQPLPVRDRKLLVVPLQQPVIDTVTPQVVSAGGLISLGGSNLKAQTTNVSFGSVMANPVKATSSRIDVNLPAGLLPGINTAQVIQPLDFGTPNEPHKGFKSNMAAFMLAPQITNGPALSATRGATLQVSVSPAVGRTQNVVLQAGNQTISIPARPANIPTSTSLSFPIPADFTPGTFLVRVQVDGAQSPLTLDTNQASPTFNQYVGPTLALT